MEGWIEGLIRGIVTGIVGPAFSYLDKKQDVTLEGFKAGTAADQASYAVYADYALKLEALKQQSNEWWGPKLLYIIVGGSASIHAAAIFLDSTFRFGWAVPPCPKPYDDYEAKVIFSLFVVSLVAAPISAATAFLHSRAK